MAKKKSEQKPELTTNITRGPFLKTDIVPAPALPTFYVNNVMIDISSLDVRLRIGQIQGVSDGALQVAEQAHLYMSHQHFRALVGAIQESLGKLDAMAVAPATPKTTDGETH